MPDLIFLKGLVVHAHHGVMKHEREVGQRFEIDLDLELDLDAASRTDRLGETVSYADVAETALAAFQAKRYQLIEAAAGAVAEAVLARFARIQRLRVFVHKPHAPIAATFHDVGVAITRGRS